MVLVVEDDANKLLRVKRVFAELNRTDVVVHHEDNALDALNWLQKNHCDVLILDLLLPHRRGEGPSKQGGEELLRKLLRADSRCSMPAQAVGLTAFNELRRDFRSLFEREGWVIAKYESSSKEWEETVANTVVREALVATDGIRSGLLLPLHGIRTNADWHRTLADVAQSENWICPIQRWWYGRFTIFQFLSPFARSAKVRWFRQRYTETMEAFDGRVSGNLPPSVVAHSFGTLILGNALVKFKDIRVDRVILCGSILPKDFPWDELIENGQVQRVLHLIGKNDRWSTICKFVIPGTGSSGREGFTCSNPHVRQEVNNLSHNEFFDSRQIRKQWFSFLNTDFPQRHSEKSVAVRQSRGDHPWVASLLSPLVMSLLILLTVFGIYCASKAFVVTADWAARLSLEAIGHRTRAGGT